ncbi:hypothetical protein KIW84_012338 [Lathyrus oleraceus]|uniref:Retrotransposon gag domain-containing protein n=1 Tax=Pisum sativum TaxID=3888 RepID=A0A9D5BHE5_PEA|nr:hypothetical protein KIW84_012338 [Pisum sativum]
MNLDSIFIIFVIIASSLTTALLHMNIVASSLTTALLHMNIDMVESAAGVWKNLQLRFSQGDIFRISDIQEDLYKFRQGSLDVSNYFTQLKVMWDELENYRPVPACSCAIPCSCGAIGSIRKYRDQDYVIRGKPQGGARGHNRVCTHCGRTNHTVETCFLKHGYPPGFKGKENYCIASYEH